MAAKQDKDFDEQLHAMDYMVYANLQLARDADARRVVDEAAGVTGFTTLRFAGPYAQAAMQARYAIERGDWKQAMTLDSRPSQFPFTTALTHFARGLGAARTGDASAADKEVQDLARLRDALKRANSDYWATEVEVSRLGVAAGTAHALGKHDEALGLMRSAADTLPRLLGRRSGGRAEWRQGQGPALLRAAGGACRPGRHAAGARASARVPGRESVIAPGVS